VDEAAVVRAARLALLGRLTRGVAHELNNPLFVVLGLVELVLRDVEPGTKAHERLSLALATGGEIRELVATVLEFARDAEPGEPGPLALQEPACEATALARRLALAKDVEFVERYPDEPVLVEARAPQLRQLFLTLLVLAERGAAGPATVTLEVGREGADAVARVAADVDAPPDAAFDLEAATAIARLHGGSLAIGRDGPLRAELRLGARG
jgi:signal transduction histidine kinase